MEVPPSMMKKNAKKKTDGEPTWWEYRLGRDVRYNIRLLEPMKMFMVTFVRSQGVQEEDEEEIDDEAMEDDDYALSGKLRECLCIHKATKRGTHLLKA
ncbi:hypothetical protein J1N35_037580 [Gossypium stocksii]|uniref:Uncharacterized protein n=1 Tax=Gossypium stocksii TaxID=47602 RepID=A0A9D3UKG6_9ROSI|nr:hypothetical protein J1N35_037580 [Gossypium stocksii]